MNNKTKFILLTGGAGFIGYHTAKLLLDRGDQVVIVDNFNRYYDPALKQARMRRLKRKYPAVKIVRADIASWLPLLKIFSRFRLTHVCHLAAQAGVRYSLEAPEVYIRTNQVGTFNVFELAKRFEVNNIVYASTSSVYGLNDDYPFTENQAADTPISIYSATKKSNESLAHAYHHLYRMNLTGLRFFTVYGPWGRPDMALFKFTRAGLAGKAIDVYNYGQMARDFTYVDDIADGIVKAIDAECGYEFFNLARGELVNLLDFINEIEAALGIKVEKNLLPMQAGDVHANPASILKARAMLGYSPKVSVREGVRKFVEWYRGYYLAL